jgi:pimeloyl-ACP methyl ester carboxylesterase
MRKIFGPAEEPQKFKREFPKGLAVRSSQLRASAAESALLIPSASDLRAKYRELSMPVVIIAGESDRLVETAAQSARLHREVRDSTFHSVPGSGHMVHQTAMSAVMAAIDEAATAGKPKAQTVPSAA